MVFQAICVFSLVSVQRISAYESLSAFLASSRHGLLKRPPYIRSQKFDQNCGAIARTLSYRISLSPWKHTAFFQDWWHRQRSIVPHSTSRSAVLLQGHYETHRDADLVEMMIGGERYSLVAMPDRMKPTTLFVGNLCEFVNDKDLSSHFSQVSSLATVPSCVVRKVNTQSMGYGFVSFPSVQEKEVCGNCLHSIFSFY
jgi:RNA recognition motif. (a.k.a. RRM, RBD, or RNP domain)